MPKSVSLFDVSDILKPLESGDLLLTPNHRLASRIKTAFSLYKSKQGIDVTLTPNVISVDQWAGNLWLELLLSGEPNTAELRVLNTEQELLLWRAIIEHSDFTEAFINPSKTAQQAMSAYKALVNFRQPLSALEKYYKTEDTQAFYQWATEFQDNCHDNKWLTQVDQYTHLLSAFEKKQLAPAKQLYTLGFDEITPLNNALIEAASDLPIITLDTPSKNKQVNTLSCNDFEDEITSAAVWAKQILKDNPANTVAIVVPDLSSQQATVRRILQEVFETQLLGQQPRTSSPFNFSAGMSLIETPVVDAFFKLLGLLQHKVTLEDINSILLSPFTSLTDEDLDNLHQLLWLIAEEQVPQISTARLRGLASQVDEQWHFVKQLQEQSTLSKRLDITEEKPPTDWQAVLPELVKAIGWPGKRSLDSIEFQQVSQLNRLIDSLNSLSYTKPKQSFSEVVSNLRFLATNHVFQAETADSSLQVLGSLEAAGLQFSHLWMTSMSEVQLPAAPAPNPFLPFQMQVELAMPHANADKEYTFADKLVARLLKDSKHIVASHPIQLDETSINISPFFAQYEEVSLSSLLGKDLSKLLPINEIHRRHFASKDIERYNPGHAPQVNTEEGVKGGTSILSNQAACPFKAYARHRLAITAIPSPSIGLTPAERGSLVHRSLELIWRKLKTQATLNEYSQQEQTKLCMDTSHYVIESIAQYRQQALGFQYLSLEKQRLGKLLVSWLDFERQRAEFIVSATELRQEYQFAGLKISARLDRVDQLTDGSLLIIDYKTGKPSINAWACPRPEEPQLPLYGIMPNQNSTATYDAIAFAQVNVDKIDMIGVGKDSTPEKKLQWQDKLKGRMGAFSWDDLKTQWEDNLIDLAKSFIAGDASVDPKKPPATCQYCEYSSVCRYDYHDTEPSEIIEGEPS